MALDPIHLVYRYFNGLGSFGDRYVRNGYLEQWRDIGFTDTNKPPGWPSDLNLAQLYQKLDAQCL